MIIIILCCTNIYVGWLSYVLRMHQNKTFMLYEHSNTKEVNAVERCVQSFEMLSWLVRVKWEKRMISHKAGLIVQTIGYLRQTRRGYNKGKRRRNRTNLIDERSWKHMAAPERWNNNSSGKSIERPIGIFFET